MRRYQLILFLASLLALAGCVMPGSSTTSRTAPQRPSDAAYAQTAAPADATYHQYNIAPPANGAPAQNWSAPNNPPATTYPPSASNNAPQMPGYSAAAPYGSSGPMTTRYIDPNVVPVGATGEAPAQAASPYDVPSAPAGPPPGYAGPTPTGPIVVAPAGIKKEDDDGEWDISHLAPDYTWKQFKQSVGWGPNEHLAQDAYDRGQALFRDKKYDEAAKEFYTATWRWPDSTLEEDAMFLMGEAYFFSDHYGSAQDTYTNLLKQHVNTRYLDTAIARLFAIGTYWEQLDLQSHHWPLTPNVTDKTQPTFDTIGNALACYALVWINDPSGPLADAALFRVANAHFRRGEWEDAAEHYDILRRNCPKSKYQKDAHLLELQAKLRIYQGPLYSVVPLKDAQQIADQLVRQFPGQLGPEEQHVRETIAMMVEQRAEREWAVGQYYDNKADYRAARTYYQVILDKYPRTAFADRARARLEAIKTLPDEPPNHFEWLTAPFGKGK